MRKIIIDCDPGVDDTVALLVAMQSKELEILGITTVAGNVGIDKTTQNALNVVNFAGRKIPVYQGEAKALKGETCSAEEVHGENGMGGYELEKSLEIQQKEKAVDFLIKTILDEEVELIAIGPLTNIAKAIKKEPKIVEKLKKITIMGGSTTNGNMTPYAEFNIYADPEAGKIVFASGLEITMCGLNLTHKAIVTREDIARISNIENKQAKFASKIIECGLEWEADYEMKGSAVHDCATLMYELHPELFTIAKYEAYVEVEGKRRGQTVVKAKENGLVTVVENVKREEFIEKICEYLAKY